MPAVSPARLAANRNNAQHSTGPRSPDGKARSSQNALTHGLSSTSLLPPEDQQPFQLHQQSLLDSLRPTNSIQLLLAQRLALLSWKLLKCSMAESALTTRTNASRQSSVERANAAAQQEYAQYVADRPYLKIIKRPPPTPQPSPAPLDSSAILLDQTLAAADNTLTRLQRYEGAAERSFFKTLKEYQQLQKLQQQNEPTDPALPPMNQCPDQPMNQSQPNEPTPASPPMNQCPDESINQCSQNQPTAPTPPPINQCPDEPMNQSPSPPNLLSPVSSLLSQPAPLNPHSSPPESSANTRFPGESPPDQTPDT